MTEQLIPLSHMVLTARKIYAAWNQLWKNAINEGYRRMCFDSDRVSYRNFSSAHH